MAIGEQQQRLLAWEGCYNVRDLGGYPTSDGRWTRWGAIVRGDNLSRLTAAGKAALVEYGVRTIVDLRLPGEIAEHPNPFAEAGVHGVRYINVSLVDPAVPRPGFTTLADDYQRTLADSPALIAEIMAAIARAPEGTVLVHCMAGKDRTGIISALLLELAGVPRATIAADYALTIECLRPLDEEWLANGPGERGWREEMHAQFSPRAEVMLEVLTYLDRCHGGVEGYLRRAGVLEEDLERIRDRLVE
jgi:protein-tyrosine phosphatase